MISGSTEVPEGSSIAWKFYAIGADGNTGEVRIWGISKAYDGTNTEYMADYICKFVLTLGANAIAAEADSLILPICKFVDTIVVEEDRAIIPGVRVISNGDNAAAVAVLDGMGYWGYIVEMRPDTPTTTSWCAFYRIF